MIPVAEGYKKPGGMIFPFHRRKRFVLRSTKAWRVINGTSFGSVTPFYRRYRRRRDDALLVCYHAPSSVYAENRVVSFVVCRIACVSFSHGHHYVYLYHVMSSIRGCRVPQTDFGRSMRVYAPLQSFITDRPSIDEIHRVKKYRQKKKIEKIIMVNIAVKPTDHSLRSESQTH